MFAYCGNSPIVQADIDGCAAETVLDHRNIVSVCPIPVPLPLLFNLVSDLYNSVIAIKESRKDVEEEAIAITDAATSQASNDAIYFGVNFYFGRPNIITGEMTFDEAESWAITTAATGTYNSRAAWGLVTERQADAISIATALGGGPPEYHAGKDSSHLPHYHTTCRTIGPFPANSFHVWMGSF